MTLIVIEFLTLDGRMQDPDGSGGTPYGGWAFRYGPQAVAGDKFGLGALLETGTLILGRATWEQFSRLWPTRTDDFSASMNRLPKLVASQSRSDFSAWNNSSRLSDDPIEEIGRRKASEDLVLIGSASLAHQLIARDLVDEYRLLVFPTVSGDGARLFEDGTRIDLDVVGITQKDAAVLITYRRPDVPQERS